MNYCLEVMKDIMQFFFSKLVIVELSKLKKSAKIPKKMDKVELLYYEFTVFSYLTKFPIKLCFSFAYNFCNIPKIR